MPPPYLFKSFMAASRKRNLSRFALCQPTQDLSAIDDAPSSSASGGPLTTVTVSSSATPVFDVSLGQLFNFTLTSNVASSSIVNGTDGQQIYLRIKQSPGGGLTFAFPPTMTVEPLFQVDQRGGAVTWLPIVFDGNSGKWEFFATPDSFLTA